MAMKLLPTLGRAGIVIFAIGAMTACAAKSASPDGGSSEESELRKRNGLPALALQYVGTYDRAATTYGSVDSLTIKRNGTYVAHFVRDEPGIDQTGTIHVNYGNPGDPG